MLVPTDPSPLLTGCATWMDVRAAFGHRRHVRAEDYLVAVLYRLLRDGAPETRRLVVDALVAKLPCEVRRRVQAAGPLTAAYLWSRRKPDIALYDERANIVLVIEAKLAQGPSQSCDLELLLREHEHDFDLSLAPGTDLMALVSADPELWQLDTYALVPKCWLPWDLSIVTADAVWVFWTGSATAEAATAYPESLTWQHWQTGRHTTTADALKPLLGTGGIPTEDQDWMDLLVRMIRVPWRGPQHPDSYLPLRLAA